MDVYCIDQFIGETVKYECPYCGEINEFYKSTIDLFLENEINYIACEGCNTKIKI